MGAAAAEVVDSGWPELLPPRRVAPSSFDLLNDPGAFRPEDPANIVAGYLRVVTGAEVDQPEGYADDALVTAYHVSEITNLIRDGRDCVVAVDGIPGDGKSAFSKDLAQRVREALNDSLGLDIGFDQSRDVVYRLSELVRRILQSSRKRPSVIIADEGVLVGAQARAGVYDASIILDRVLSVSRIQGCTIFVLAPSIWGLAAFVRNRRARLWYHIESRGTATAFHLKKEIEFTPPKQLPFKKFPQPWNRLHWEDPEEADPVSWGSYEARKLDVTSDTLVDAIMESVRLEKKAGMRAPDWLRDFERSITRVDSYGDDRPADRKERRRKYDRDYKRQQAASNLRAELKAALSSEGAPA